MHIVSEHIAYHTYYFKHSCINIFITKMQHTPNIYQQTHPTYKSLGASDTDMQRGTTLVFILNILNLKVLFGKGPREKINHNF